MDNPATTAALTARGYTPTDSGVAQTRLDEAWRALQRELRILGTSVEAALAAEWVTSDDLVDVIAGAALRVLDNPLGVTEDSAAVDDYRESRKLANSTRDVYFTAAELRRLVPPTPPLTAGSFKYS